ncbi:MAG: ASCH domain-containing protein, partial [Pasteurellaceae bacterium]|nr:ASCH domain-containing protein [Pasteurellaceae bacterium]
MENPLQWAFGGSPNYLAALVLAGRKTATCSGRLFYTLENEPLPQADGKVQTILDGQGKPLVDIQLTDVFVEQFGKVSEDFALAEGEGSFAEWREAHQQFFNAEIGNISDFLPPLQGVENGQITAEFELV